MTTIAAPRPAATPTAPMVGIGHNRPPLDEEVVAEFEEGLKSQDGLLARIDGLCARADAVTDCADAEAAGKLADGIKMMKAALAVIEAEREKHNRPLLNAQRALKGRADTYATRLNNAEAKLRRLINAWQTAENARIAEQRRAAEEAARAAQKAAMEAAAEAPHGAQPVVEVKPAEVEAPIARGDYGAKVGTQTVWKHEIQSVRQLPDSILKHAKVVEAIDKVVAQLVRTGTREIKGVRIWDEQQAVIR